MPLARQKLCGFPGCNLGEPDADGNPTAYVTPEGIATRAEVAEDLKDHVHMAHELALRFKEVDVEKIRAEAAKISAEATKLAAGHPPVAPTVMVPQGTPRSGSAGLEDWVAREKRAVIP